MDNIIHVTHIAVVQTSGIKSPEYSTATITHDAFGSFAEAASWVASELSAAHDIGWDGAEFLANYLMDPDMTVTEIIADMKGEISVEQLNERVWEVTTTAGPTTGWIIRP